MKKLVYLVKRYWVFWLIGIALGQGIRYAVIKAPELMSAQEAYSRWDRLNDMKQVEEVSRESAPGVVRVWQPGFYPEFWYECDEIILCLESPDTLKHHVKGRDGWASIPPQQMDYDWNWIKLYPKTKAYEAARLLFVRELRKAEKAYKVSLKKEDAELEREIEGCAERGE